MKILAILEFALVALCILGSFVSGTNFIISFFIYLVISLFSNGFVTSDWSGTQQALTSEFHVNLRGPSREFCFMRWSFWRRAIRIRLGTSCAWVWGEKSLKTARNKHSRTNQLPITFWISETKQLPNCRKVYQLLTIKAKFFSDVKALKESSCWRT